MRLTIAYFKIKKRNLVLIDNDTHQRETLSERPIRPPLKQALFSKDGMYSGREFQMRAADGTKDLLWLTRLERGIWTAKSCDLTERLRRGSN